jgi:hypothetical protein
MRRSTCGFCQGDRGAVREHTGSETSRLPQRTCRSPRCRPGGRAGSFARSEKGLQVAAGGISRRGLADVDAELEQFAVDAGRAPQGWRGSSGGSDRGSRCLSWAVPDTVIATASNIGSLAMPLDHGCRLNQHHGIEDLRPNPVKPNRDKSIRREKPNPTWMPAPQDAHLMSRGNELKFKVGAATNTER